MQYNCCSAPNAIRRGAVLLLAMLLLIGGCGPRPAPHEGASAAVPETAARARILVTGAGISGANGVHFGPDGLLYVASVIGSELLALNPQDGTVQRRLTAADGVLGPDDVAFGPDGAFYWTSILTGQVAGFTADGDFVVAAELDPGVNPLTFSSDGRLFVAQCFFADGLFEVDPQGRTEPRSIADDLGPGCGLNGMDWGPDDRLYGPRWFHGEVVSFDVDDGTRRLEVSDLGVPAAVKFDSRGRLHVLDTAAGQVLRIAGGERQVVADLMPGLDNFAFDAHDTLFVSSFADGSVLRVEADGSVTELSPAGLAHPAGVAIWQPPGADGPQVVVADLHALRGFDPDTGASTFTVRNVLGIGPLGSVLSVAADGANLILTAFTDGDVRIWDPAAGTVVARHEGFDAPVSAIRYHDRLVVAEHGARRVVALDAGDFIVLAEDLEAPTGLATDGERLFVSDRARGQVLEIARAGAAVPPRIVADGLRAPEGLAWLEDGLVVVEGESGRVLQVGDDGQVRLLTIVAPGTPPAGTSQPPSMVFNGVAAAGRTLFVSGETTRVLYRIDLDAAATAVE